MIDLDELHDKMISYRLVGFTKSDISTIDALEILSRLQQAEKDAARYRWLKEQGRHDYDVDDFFDGSCDRIDEKVDEAMQCSK